MKRSILFVICTLYAVFCKAQNDSKLWTTRYDGSTFSHMETGFSNDSKYYAYGSNDGKIFIRDVNTAEIYNAYQEHQDQIFCVCFQPTGSLIASGDKKGNIVLYDYSSKKKIFSFEAHSKAVATLSFSPDGKNVISGSGDNTVKIWDAATGSKIREIKDIKGNVCFAKVTPDGKKLIIATKAMSNGITIYDFLTGTEISKVPGELIERADLSPDGRYLATANLQKKLSVWDLNSQGLDGTLDGHQKTANCVAYSPDGQYLASGGQDKDVIIWDGSYSVKTFNTGSDWMENVVFSPNSEYLAVLNKGGDLSMYNVNKLLNVNKSALPASTETSAVETLPDNEPMSSGSTIYALFVADTTYGAALSDFIKYIEFNDQKYLTSANKKVDDALLDLNIAIDQGRFDELGQAYFVQAVKTKSDLNALDILEYKLIRDELTRQSSLSDAEKDATISCFYRKDNNDIMGYPLRCSSELKRLHEKLLSRLDTNNQVIVITVATLKTYLKE